MFYNHIASLKALAEHFSAHLSFEEFCRRKGLNPSEPARMMWEDNESLHIFRERAWKGEIASFQEATKNFEMRVVGQYLDTLFLRNGERVDTGNRAAPPGWLKAVRALIR